MARPRIKLDEKQIETLAKIGCTHEEIAAVCGVSVHTIERRYLDVVHRAKEEFKASIRRLQYKSAQAGNVTAQIWLGKQYLGQSDKSEVKNENINISADRLTDDELAAIAAGGSARNNKKAGSKKQLH